MARHAAAEPPPAPFRCPRCTSAALVDFGSQLCCRDCGCVLQVEPVEVYLRRDGGQR